MSPWLPRDLFFSSFLLCRFLRKQIGPSRSSLGKMKARRSDGQVMSPPKHQRSVVVLLVLIIIVVISTKMAIVMTLGNKSCKVTIPVVI